MKQLIAILLIGIAFQACKPSTQELYEQASLRFDQDDFAGAIQLLDSIIAVDDTRGDVFHTRGSSKFNLKDFDGAVADYTRAIELSGSKVDAELYYYRGDAHLMLKEYEKAIENFSMAVTLIPDYAEAYNLRGDSWIATGNADSAFIDYSRSIKLNPDLPGAYFGLASYYSNASNHNQAIANYSKAIGLKAMPDYYYNRGLVYYLENDFDSAISDFSKTLELDSQHLDAYVMRGSVRDEAGLKAEAISDFDVAINLDPNYGFAYFNRGITRKSQGDTKGACEDFNKALELGYLEAIAKTGDCVN
ncbi:MAG TPA: tetratricopeptide repeat protein [Cyclobacteriaceae bacterium]